MQVYIVRDVDRIQNSSLLIIHVAKPMANRFISCPDVCKDEEPNMSK